MNFRPLGMIIGFGLFAGTAHASAIQYTCEFWHPRLGLMPEDYKYALDLEAQRCDGEPCNITDRELSWSTQGGRYSIKIDRLTQEGQIVREDPLLTVLKNCRAVTAKP